MIIRPFYLACLAHASYLVADPVTRVAAVIDPQRDIASYISAAAADGLTIRHVILTHFHADFVAGHLELRAACGAEVHLGARATAGYAFTPAADGDDIVLGQVRLRVVATPGHTPEGITLLAHDGDPAHPRAAFTGDTLFIGDVGRPDLLASVGSDATSLAHALHDSLARLLTLPDGCLVYPAHGAGSLCGRALSKETVSTIGEQRRGNHALQPMTRERFVELVTSDLPPTPPYFAHDVALNRDGYAPGASGAVVAAGLDLARVLQEISAGAQVLDVRDATAFAGAHLRGSVNVGLRGQFATWAGTVLDPARAIVLIADPGQEAEAVLRLGRIGFDRVIGHVAGGMAALAGRPDLVASGLRVAPGDLAQVRVGAAMVVDVRAPGEFAQGAIPGAVNIPLQELPRRFSEIPISALVVVHCAGGYRSSAAASLLRTHGRETADLIGGYAAWKAAVAAG